MSLLITSYITDTQSSFYAMWAVETVKSAAIVIVMDILTAGKSDLWEEKSQSLGMNDMAFFASTTFIKSISHFYLIPLIEQDSAFHHYSLLVFIIKSFCFEIVFDLLHYWTHRIAHSNALVYKWIHKSHHKYNHPNAFTTFYMSPLDVSLTYCLPLAVSLYVVPLNRWQFNLMTTFLTYQEVGGHLNKQMAPTSSFAQCVWIPRILRIELHTEDHNLHHTKVICNFSKRFSLWDKVFGTYRSGIKSVIIADDDGNDTSRAGTTTA